MKTIGIIGGMGPEASGDLFFKILRETDAACDQAHIPILLDSNTRIPDRTAAILSGGADPRPELIRSAKRLEQAGAEVLVMSCNTAHYFYEDIIKEISVPFLHMPRLTAEAVKEQGMKKVALLATSGTVNSFSRSYASCLNSVAIMITTSGGFSISLRIVSSAVLASQLHMIRSNANLLHSLSIRSIIDAIKP